METDSTDSPNGTPLSFVCSKMSSHMSHKMSTDLSTGDLFKGVFAGVASSLNILFSTQSGTCTPNHLIKFIVFSLPHGANVKIILTGFTFRSLHNLP